MQKPCNTGRSVLSDIASNMNSLTNPILSPVIDTFGKSDTINNFTSSVSNGLVNSLAPSTTDKPALNNLDIEQLKKIDLNYLALFRKSSKFPNQGFNHFFLSQELDSCDNPIHNYDFQTDSDTNGSNTRLASPSRSEEVSNMISTDSHAIYCLSFSLDGKYLAAAGADGLVRVWEVITSEIDRSTDYNKNMNSSMSNLDVVSTGTSTSNGYSRTDRRSYIDNNLDDTYINSIKSGRHRSGSRSSGSHRKNTITSQDSNQNHGSSSKPNIYAPLFRSKPIKTFYHEKTINSLDWSINNFLLSSSEDGVVKLWHVDRADCLQTYKFESVVTCAKFHTLDDRFFFTTQWNGKLTFLSILEQEIVYEIDLMKQLTCLELSPNSDLVFIGCDKGYMFSIKFNKGFIIEADYQYKKHCPRISGMRIMGTDINNLKIIISATDSRIRLVNYTGRFLEVKYSGHTNKSSNIMATSNENDTHIITGSEDGWVYFWQLYSNNTEKVDRERKKRLFNKGNLNLLKFFKDDDSGIMENKSYGSFHTNQSNCNVAIFAPRATLKLLQLSNDPIFELRNEYADLMKKEGIKDLESDDLSTSIILTADSTGKIKIFRRDSSHYIRKALSSKKIRPILESRRGSFSSGTGTTSHEEEITRGRSIGTNKFLSKTGTDSMKFTSLQSVPNTNFNDDKFSQGPSGSARTLTSGMSNDGTMKQTMYRSRGDHRDDTPSNAAIVPDVQGIDDEIRKLLIDSKDDTLIMQNQHSNSNTSLISNNGTTMRSEDAEVPNNNPHLICGNCQGVDFSAKPMGSSETNEIKFYCNNCGQVSGVI